MVIKFEKIVFFCEIMTIEQDMGSNFLSEHLIIIPLIASTFLGGIGNFSRLLRCRSWATHTRRSATS